MSDEQLAEGRVKPRKRAMEVLAELERNRDQVAQFAAAIEASAALAATRCTHVEEGSNYIDAKRSEITGLFDNVQKQVAQIDELCDHSEQMHSDVKDVKSACEVVVKGTQTLADEIKRLRDDAAKYAASTESLAAKAETLEKKVTDYLELLSNLQKTCEDRLKVIDSLLPGATSAGLAEAFGRRKREFLPPQWRWQGVFIVSIFALIGLAGSQLWLQVQAAGSKETHDWLLTFARFLPLTAPIVWLAIYSSRQAALAKRMEEEYAHKEVVSRSFEGYLKQFELIEGTGDATSITKLCVNSLDAIAAHPGRIYQKSKSDVTPLSLVTENAAELKKLIDGVAQLAPSIEAFQKAVARESKR